MEIITQNQPNIQQKTITNILSDVLREIPIVLTNGTTEAFILVKDLSEEMEKFILTGKSSTDILLVFSEEYERKLIEQWESAGFKHSYHYQPLEYMNRNVKIKYLQVSNPTTGINISLIPWFSLPGRPYPVFLYAYAFWHYENSHRKSMEISAMVAGKIFGVSSFNKSTLSRNIKAMEELIHNLRLDKPLSAIEPVLPSSLKVLDRIPELLEQCTSFEMLSKACGVKIGRTPRPIERGGEVKRALSSIPRELSEAVKDKEQIKKGVRDLRKRPARQRAKNDGSRVQRILNYVDSKEIEQIRLRFITLFKACVLDAAVKFHRFLI